MNNSVLVSAGAIAAAVVILVGAIALWIPSTVSSTRRTAILRTASLVLGVVFAILSDLATGLSGFSNLVPAGLAGLTIGAGVTISVAGVYAGQAASVMASVLVHGEPLVMSPAAEPVVVPPTA